MVVDVHANAYLRIGQLAAEFGLNPKTIRYYEAIGSLPPPERTDAGYRLYTDADVERLRFIGKAKLIGLSLDEIREIFRLRSNGEPPCGCVLSMLDQKVAVGGCTTVCARGVPAGTGGAPRTGDATRPRGCHHLWNHRGAHAGPVRRFERRDRHSSPRPVAMVFLSRSGRTRRIR